MRRVRGLWFVCILPIIACSAKHPARLQADPKALRAQDYPAILEAWSSSSRVYQGFDSVMFATATYHAPEFRRAFATAFPEIYGHGGNVTRRELVDMSAGVHRFHNFFLSVHTPDVRSNDLAKSDSIWRITFDTDDNRAEPPAEILPVKIDENLKVVYPYISRFDRAYLVRFPLEDAAGIPLIDPSTRTFRVRIASALGCASLNWTLSP